MGGTCCGPNGSVNCSRPSKGLGFRVGVGCWNVGSLSAKRGDLGSGGGVWE